jgi:prepilin-type N-terminal cleavage/methylation domain-containing protein
MTARSTRRRGLTLLELLAVLTILAVVAGIVVPMVANITSGESFHTPGGPKSAQRVATEATMTRVRDAIMGSGENPGYYGDLGTLPWPQDGSRQDHPQLRYLFVNPATEDDTRDFDPNTRRGWRGPYVLGSTGHYTVDVPRGLLDLYGENGDPALIDAWGSPIVIALRSQSGRMNGYLVSAGKDAVLGTPDDLELLLREDL